MTLALFWKCLFVFIDLIAVDFCWAKYTKKVSDSNAPRAAFWSMSIMILGAFAVISYMTNPWLLIPAALGAWCGTYMAVKPRFFTAAFTWFRTYIW
jgi:hypothetical protein